MFLFTLLFIIFTSCASAPAPQTDTKDTTSFFNTIPGANELVFIGVAGRRSDPKETLQFALEDAARRAAIFHKVSGEYAVKNTIGSGAFDYTHDTAASIHYDIEGSKQYVDLLQFNADTDTLEIENVLFIRTTYPSSLSVPIKYRPAYNNQKPNWVNNPFLDIAGYEVVVGYAGRHSSMVDTYTNSRNNAIYGIIRNLNTVSQSSDLLYTSTESLFGYKTYNDNTIYSYGTLTGFYVLDTWIDPKEKTVWTLAIAKKSK